MRQIPLLLTSSLNQMKMDSHLQLYIILLIINLQGRQSRWLTSISSHQMELNHQTTQGWKFLVKWSNGLCQWIDLKLLKESNPVQVADYATSRNMAEEPAFAWWVPYVLRKLDTIVKAVNSCVCRTSHKYGIELPTSVKHTIDIDCKSKNTC